MNITKLAAIVVTTLSFGCEPSTLQGIDGAGSASNGLDPEDDDTMGPVLVHLHEDGIDAYQELQNNVIPVGGTIFAPSEPARRLGRRGNDLIVVADTGTPNEVQLWRYPDFAAGGNAPAVASAPLSIDAIGEDETILGVHGERGLWLAVQDMVTTPTSGTAGLTLHWSPSGSIDGPWRSQRVNGFIDDWALIGDGSLAVMVGQFHTSLLEVRQSHGTFGSSLEAFAADGLVAVEYHDGSLYAAGMCFGPPACEGSGPGVFVWRNVDADPGVLQGTPQAIVALPEIPDFTHYCSVAVNDAAVVVGTCRTQETAVARLVVFRDPAGLEAGAQPDEVVALEDSALQLSAIAWPAGDLYQRTLTVFVRARRNPVVHMYDDRSGSLSRTGADIASAMVPPGTSLDILVLD